MEVFAISGLINGFMAISIGVFILYRNLRSRFNWTYFLFSLSVFVWAIGYWFWLKSADYNEAILWARVFVFGSVMVPVFLLHWFSIFLGIEKQQKRLLVFVYILGFLLLAFSFTPLMVSGLKKALFFPFWPIPGPLYSFYMIADYFLFSLYGLYMLISNFKKCDRIKKMQIVYIVIGSIVGYGGAATNFFLWYNIPIAPYGNFLVAFYGFFMAYAVLRLHLFEIKLIASDIFTFFILAFLFVRTVLSPNMVDFALNGLMFFAMMGAGIFLSRSVLKEAEQKEELAIMNKKIQKAYELEKKAREDILRAYEIEKRAASKLEKAYNMEKNLRQKLEKLNNAKNQFMVATQHYLRTPLTAMMYNLEMIFSGDFGAAPKKITSVLSNFRVSTFSLIRMVNEMLDVSQFQIGKKIAIFKSEFDIGKMINEIMGEIRPSLKNKKLDLVFEKPEAPIIINADEQRLKITIFNLIDNAVKYTPKGEITVQLNILEKKSGRKLLIAVKDTGIGILKEDIGDLFSKTYERGKKAKETFSLGRGIGLFVAGQIIKSHKGKIWAESEGKNKGSVFYIELPM